MEATDSTLKFQKAKTMAMAPEAKQHNVQDLSDERGQRGDNVFGWVSLKGARSTNMSDCSEAYDPSNGMA